MAYAPGDLANVFAMQVGVETTVASWTFGLQSVTMAITGLMKVCR